MTETTALLRAIHCDMVAVSGLLSALFYAYVGDESPYEGVVSKALDDANVYCSIANEFAMKNTGSDAHGNRSAD